MVNCTLPPLKKYLLTNDLILNSIQNKLSLISKGWLIIPFQILLPYLEQNVMKS